MNTRAGKNQENQSRTAANSVSKKESGRNATFQFVDSCPEAMQLRKLQEMANNSPQVKQLEALQEVKSNKTLRMKSANTDLPIQEMSQEERNALREADYESNVSWYDWKGREDNQFLKAVIKHKKDNYYNIQVGYHVNTGWWTLRWANEGRGNVNPPDWVREIVQPYIEHT